MDLKNALTEIVHKLRELEGVARTLPNQNFADIVKAGSARLAQVTEHPDLDKVQEALTAHLDGPKGEPLPFDKA